MPDITPILLALTAAALGVLVTLWITRGVRRLTRGSRVETITVRALAERVQAVGRLVGLEVRAKEIATATSGWAWLPPVLLSQARLAMIFNFEKQYSVDLSTVQPGDIQERPDGGYRVRLPPVSGSLRLLDVTPYDIQGAKVLGLLDVVSMTADRQRELMRKAQEQAAALYESHDARYLADARRSIERHLTSLLDLFGVAIEVAWADQARATPPPSSEEAAPRAALAAAS